VVLGLVGALVLIFPCSLFSSLKACRPSATSDLFFLVFFAAHFSSTQDLSSRQGFTLCSLILLIILEQISAQESAKGACLVSHSQPVFLFRFPRVSAHFGLLPHDQLALVHSRESAAQSRARVGVVRSVSCATSTPFGPESILSQDSIHRVKSPRLTQDLLLSSQFLRFPHWVLLLCVCCRCFAEPVLFLSYLIKKLKVF
jgi:hypothetical protein